jgi:predicted nucleic acid-binding protein
MLKIPHNIIADSSFYSCFLDDINDPDFLYRIIEKFDFYITPIVECEIKIEKNKSLKENKKIIRIDNYIDFGEILKPFLSKKIIDKGEHEVIGLGFHFLMIGIPFYLVIDDKEARSFVKKNLSVLCACLHGTVGLIYLCCCNFGIFSKSETVATFNKIENSKFRISKEILHKIKNDVEIC